MRTRRSANSGPKADQASAQASEARAAETGTRLQILQEVQNSARDVEVARQRLALAQQEKDTASEAAASARRGFGEGLTSSLDVLSANEMLFYSEVQVASAGRPPAPARLGGILHFDRPLSAKAAGTCTLDAVCPTGDSPLDAAIAERKKSMARISFVEGGGAFHEHGGARGTRQDRGRAEAYRAMPALRFWPIPR
jgi:hypothetical protein